MKDTKLRDFSLLTLDDGSESHKGLSHRTSSRSTNGAVSNRSYYAVAGNWNSTSSTRRCGTDRRGTGAGTLRRSHYRWSVSRPMIKLVKYSPYTALNVTVTHTSLKSAPKPPDCNTAYTCASNRQNLAEVVGAAKASLTQRSTVKPTACLFRSTPCVCSEKVVWNISSSVVLANTLYGSEVLFESPWLAWTWPPL